VAPPALAVSWIALELLSLELRTQEHKEELLEELDEEENT